MLLYQSHPQSTTSDSISVHIHIHTHTHTVDIIARAEAFAAWLARVAPREGLRPASLRIASADASFRR